MSFIVILRSDVSSKGFTLIELIMVMLLLTILSVTAYVKWPAGMDDQAAKLEFKQAIHYAQHMAVTRKWMGASDAWGIMISGNRYYVGRANANCIADCSNSGCGESGFCGRALLGDNSISLSSSLGSGPLLFNGYGEPIAANGALLGNTVFTVDGSLQFTVCQQTGYVLEGGHCP